MIAFIITLALTLYMSGLIWSMQILEYPLFALVGPKEFPASFCLLRDFSGHGFVFLLF